MPDIAMCHGTNRHGQQCPRMARCYRAQAEPALLQSYFKHAPPQEDGQTCGHFWPMGKKQDDD